MTKMVETLKQDQANEVDEKDDCRNDLHETDMEMESRYRDKKDLETHIADLTELQERGGDELKATKDELLNTRQQMKKASADRQAGNANFKKVVFDQRTTQELLEKALKKLENFYNKAALLQGKASPV